RPYHGDNTDYDQAHEHRVFNGRRTSFTVEESPNLGDKRLHFRLLLRAVRNFDPRTIRKESVTAIQARDRPSSLSRCNECAADLAEGPADALGQIADDCSDCDHDQTNHHRVLDRRRTVLADYEVTDFADQATHVVLLVPNNARSSLLGIPQID